MKKFLLAIAAAATVASAMAFPKAFYVKKGEVFTKYNFGVAENLHFTDNGSKLRVEGYEEVIDLDKIDYISFSAPVSTALTPAAQKEKMVQIGSEAFDMVDVNDNPGMMKMFDAFFLGYYTNSNMTEWHTPPVEYDIDRSYYDVHNEFCEIVRAAARLVKGDPAAARVMRAKTINLYKIEDYNGIYTADDVNRKWVKTPADYFEIRFRNLKGENFSLRLDAGTDYTVWNTKDFNLRFSRKIDFTFAMEGQPIGKAVLETVLVQDKSIDMTFTFSANGYVAVNTMAVVNNGIDDKVEVSVNGKQLCNAVAHIDGRNLVDYNRWYDDVKDSQGYYDEGTQDYIDGDPSGIISHFLKAGATADVLGKLKLDSKFLGFKKMYDSLEEDPDIYYTMTDGKYRVSASGKIIARNGSTYDITYEEKDIVENHVNILNNYIDASFKYTGDAMPQGYLGFEVETVNEEYGNYYPDYSDGTFGYIVKNDFLIPVRRDYEEVYNPATETLDRVWKDWTYSRDIIDENGNCLDYEEVAVNEGDIVRPEQIRRFCYEATPLLIFPDGTSYAFEDFFDEVSFKSLINDYDAITDSYFGIVGREKDTHN